MNILVANGVNLDVLGKRQPQIYGTHSLSQINKKIESEIGRRFSVVNLKFFQSNLEGEFINSLVDTYDAFVINPGAWSHTSLAIADRIAGIEKPFVEVHLSQLYAREEIVRQTLVTGKQVDAVITGMGWYGYVLAVDYLFTKLSMLIK